MGKAVFLGPSVRTLPSGKLDGAQLRGMGRINAPTMRNWLGDGRISVTMPARIDFFGSVDLLGCKKAIADKGVDMPGNPVTSTFALDMPWNFTIEANKDANVNVFESKPYEWSMSTDSPIPPGTFKNQQAMNWILQYFGLKGVKMTALEINPTLKGGGMESSNMVTGAASIFGSILSGADYSLGRLFTLATLHENVVHSGLTGGQGLTAGITGGAYGFEWIDGYEPFAAIGHELFGPERYQEFKDHVLIFLPPKTGERKGGSVDINTKWTDDMMKTLDGNLSHRNFVKWSREVMDGLIAGDWGKVGANLQKQSDVRTASCPAFMDGFEPLAAALKDLAAQDGSAVGTNRGGAGGNGTASYAVFENPALLAEARKLIGNPVEFTDEVVAKIKDPQTPPSEFPSGEIPYNLQEQGIEVTFEGLTEGHGFQKPELPQEVDI